MKILVAIKRVIDFKTSVRVKADETDVETANVKMSMNPFDEIAVEEAIRFKEQEKANEIVVVSIGPEQCQEVLRTALAMGADRGILVKTAHTLQPLIVAKILRAIVQQENPRLILMGKQAIDSDNNQTGQMLAGLLNWPQGTFASKVACDNTSVTVTREIDGGLETLALTLPAVITTDLRLNEPRYISLPNIVQAKRKPIQMVSIEEFNVDLSPRLKILKVKPPEKRRSGIKVATVTELVDKLKHEAQV